MKLQSHNSRFVVESKHIVPNSFDTEGISIYKLEAHIV